MEVNSLKTSDVLAKASPYNPRRISEADFASLRRSLREFGLVEPVVVNRRTDRIVGGHQRARAAEAEAIETLPVVYVDLDEAKEKALNLALNRISGEFDAVLLRELIETIEDDTIRLTGFDDGEIQDLLRDASYPDPEEPTTEEAIGVVEIYADEGFVREIRPTLDKWREDGRVNSINVA